MYSGAGPGQYAQPPMSAGMGGPMVQQGSQPNQMPPHMAMQQNHPVQQPRMMMQQPHMQGVPGGMRPPYAQPAMMAQHGMVNMYGQPQMPSMRVNQNEMYNRFPHDWKQQGPIPKETAPEKRHKTMNYAKIQQQQQQQQQHQQIANRAIGQHPYNTPQHMMPPNRAHPMYPNPGSNMQQMSHPSVPLHPPSQQPHTITNRRMIPNSMHGNIPQNLQPSMHTTMASSPSAPGVGIASGSTGMPTTQSTSTVQRPMPSPQVTAFATNTAPSGSPGSAMNANPGSAPSPQISQNLPLHTQPVMKPTGAPDPEYEQLKNEMKEKYYEQLKRVGDRCTLDNCPKPRGFTQLMEIFEAKRDVNFKLLTIVREQLIGVLEKYSLSYDVMSEVKKMHKEISDCKPASAPASMNSGAHDPWKPVRHKFIKVPDDIMKLISDDETSSAKAEKRHLNADSDDAPPTKAAKIEIDGAATVHSFSQSASGINAIRRFSRRVASTDDEEAGSRLSSEEGVKQIEIECLFDQTRKWVMSTTASAELQHIPWRIERDALPPSFRSPDVILSFDSLTLSCHPLLVLVPQTYPLDSPVIQFDKSFPSGAPLSKQLSMIFERCLSLASSRSLTCIYEAFRSACEELVKLKGVLNGHYIPSKHQQKQLVA